MALKIQPGVPAIAPKQTPASADVDPRQARITQLYAEADKLLSSPGSFSTKALLLGAKLDEVHKLQAELRLDLQPDLRAAAVNDEITKAKGRNTTLQRNDPAGSPVTKQLVAANDKHVRELELELRALSTPQPKSDAVDGKKAAAPTVAQAGVAQTKATTEAQTFAALQSRNAGGLFGVVESPSPKADTRRQVEEDLRKNPELEPLRDELMKLAQK